MTEIEVLQQCTIKEKTVFLPEIQLDRKLYQQVVKKLEMIGGKWNRKAKGFIFELEPDDLLNEVQQGGSRNIKKEYQFFATPDDLADTLVAFAFETPFQIGHVLEPSAGQGAIINAIHREDSDICVKYLEILNINRAVLAKSVNVDGIDYLGDDFMKYEPTGRKFSTIIANPPFANRQDIDHIRKMYEVCEPGGRIVTMASTHWTFAENKKSVEFRQWLKDINAEILEVEPETFKQSGTNIETRIIIINK